MRILMLEDDLKLSALVTAYLRHHFTVESVSTVKEAEEYIDHFKYNVVLLDRNINDEDIGMSLIERVKTKDSTAGVIVISAYGSITDKISGLNLGADDYLEKPFDNDELLARIYAISRRNQNTPTLEYNGLSCDSILKTLSYEQQAIPLTRKESDLFFYLIQKRGKIVSKDELLDALYLNPQNISSNTIDVTIGHIRKKLPIAIIKTIKTRGYIIEC